MHKKKAKKKKRAQVHHTHKHRKRKKEKLDLSENNFWARFRSLFGKFKRKHTRVGPYPDLEKIYEQDSPHRKKQKIDAKSDDGYIEYQEFEKKVKKL